MRRAIAVLGLAACVVLGASVAGAQESPKPRTPDELLRQIRSARERQRELDQRREAEFRAARQEQQRLLNEARAARSAAEAKSQVLEGSFEQNENELTDLQETLRNRMGTLGELFGVVRQVAGDTRGFVESSIISAQLPGRDRILGQLAQAKELPSAEDLEQLWFTLQEEMTESGKVVRFPGTVVGLDGDETEREIVRVGPFNVISEGHYLQYLPETGKLGELARQPGARHLRAAAAFEKATEGLVGVPIDPSRGAILSLLIQTPGLSERIRQGGLVGYVIIVLGLGGLVLVVERLVSLGIVGRRIKAQRVSTEVRGDNPLGRVLEVYARNPTADTETLELKMDEAILKEVPRLERGNTMIKVLSVVAPLLGLLGTVTGMISTFQAITLFGTGDPRLMAGGISQALVTTVLGLTVAIPLLILHSVVAGRSRVLIQILDEQSAGIVARHAEGLRGAGRVANAAAG